MDQKKKKKNYVFKSLNIVWLRNLGPKSKLVLCGEKRGAGGDSV